MSYVDDILMTTETLHSYSYKIKKIYSDESFNDQQISEEFNDALNIFKKTKFKIVCEKIEVAIEGKNQIEVLENFQYLINAAANGEFRLGYFYVVKRYIELVKAGISDLTVYLLENLYDFGELDVLYCLANEIIIEFITEFKRKFQFDTKMEYEVLEFPNDYGWTLLDGVYDDYIKHVSGKAKNRLKYSDFEMILETVYWFPNFIIGSKPKHLPNKKYTDEMFENCWREQHIEERKLQKAIELTLAKYNLPMEIHGFRQQYYVYQNRLRKK